MRVNIEGRLRGGWGYERVRWKRQMRWKIGGDFGQGEVRWNNESGKPSQLQVATGQVEALTTSERVKEGGGSQSSSHIVCLWSTLKNKKRDYDIKGDWGSIKSHNNSVLIGHFKAPNWVGGLVSNAGAGGDNWENSCIQTLYSVTMTLGQTQVTSLTAEHHRLLPTGIDNIGQADPTQWLKMCHNSKVAWSWMITTKYFESWKLQLSLIKSNSS